MTKVAVIIILSSEAAIGTEIEPSWAMALLFVDTCFDEVWSNLLLTLVEYHVSPLDSTMRCANFSSASLLLQLVIYFFPLLCDVKQISYTSKQTFSPRMLMINSTHLKSGITMCQAFCCGKSNRNINNTTFASRGHRKSLYYFTEFTQH